MRTTLLVAALLATTVPPVAAQDAQPPFADKLSGAALVEALRGGGHVLLHPIRPHRVGQPNLRQAIDLSG